ncbi:transcriptional regulator [Bacteroidia bacterium]|nr:transcriptional regulator [Bacteroidia bacterium]GHU57475.1 transcriptional regulator [Bacteroidia bacterium]
MKQVEEMLEELRKLIVSRFDAIEKKLDKSMKVKIAMEGDKLLDNQDLCLLLGITKRSLARYRQKKLIRYYQIDRKTYYKASEVQEFLKTRGKKLE